MNEKNESLVDLASKLQEAFIKKARGNKYSFLSKRQIKRIRGIYTVPMGDGRNMYVRTFS